MRTYTVCEKGDKVTVRPVTAYGLCTRNSQGGTEAWRRVAILVVTRTWVDYETGRHYVGKDSKGKEFYFGETGVEITAF